MHFTRRNQDEIKAAALAPTGSTAWMKDAIAIAASISLGDSPVAIAIFQNFRGGEADFHFASLDGHRVSAGTVKAMMFVAFHPGFFNLQRAWMHVKASNPTAQAACLKIGAEFEYRLRAGIDRESDVIVFSRLRTGPQSPLPGALIETQA